MATDGIPDWLDLADDGLGSRLVTAARLRPTLRTHHTHGAPSAPAGSSTFAVGEVWIDRGKTLWTITDVLDTPTGVLVKAESALGDRTSMKAHAWRRTHTRESPEVREVVAALVADPPRPVVFPDKVPDGQPRDIPDAHAGRTPPDHRASVVDIVKEWGESLPDVMPDEMPEDF